MQKRRARGPALLAALIAVGCGKGPAVPPPPPPGAAPAPVRTDVGAPAGPVDAGASRSDALAEAGAADAAVMPEAPMTDAREPVRDADPADAGAGMSLASDGFLILGGERVFPRSASYPVDESPPFTFQGVPATAKSLAFTFVDRSNGATKWVIWDIPPGTLGLPANLSKTVHPREIPAATQRGSLGRTGYSGPGVRGPPLHTYDFVLWALDVAALPVPAGASTARIRTEILPGHVIAKSATFTAKGQLGGP